MKQFYKKIIASAHVMHQFRFFRYGLWFCVNDKNHYFTHSKYYISFFIMKKQKVKYQRSWDLFPYFRLGNTRKHFNEYIINHKPEKHI